MQADTQERGIKENGKLRRIEKMKERKKQLDIDLWFIFIISMLILSIYIFFNEKINAIAYNAEINIVLRVLLIGGIFQYGLAGLGITVVSVMRKESFRSYGLHSKNLLKTLIWSMLCCVPDFVYNLFAGNLHKWFPFADVNLTSEVLASGFPYSVLGMAIIAICWGFFEGFNYVVIADKISERYPSKIKFLDWGAFVCAVMCILVHGVIGVTPDAIIEMLCTMFLIYGMLMVRKQTGNAWGCVLIFFVFWNAL